MSGNKVKNFTNAHVDFTDELGQKWEGDFEEIKVVLSVNEKAQLGRNRRAIMGAVTGDSQADNQDFYYAQAISEVNTRCKLDTTPVWWQKAGGADLFESVVNACFVAVGTAVDEHLKQFVTKPAEKAAEELRKDRDKRREQEKA